MKLKAVKADIESESMNGKRDKVKTGRIMCVYSVDVMPLSQAREWILELGMLELWCYE